MGETQELMMHSNTVKISLAFKNAKFQDLIPMAVVLE